jgi:hypothetical protein
MNGLIGYMVSFIKKNDVVGGTQGGLDNMVKLSEEAQFIVSPVNFSYHITAQAVFECNKTAWSSEKKGQGT